MHLNILLSQFKGLCQDKQKHSDTTTPHILPDNYAATSLSTAQIFEACIGGLTSPSQLLIATEASGMSLTSPVKTQSPKMRSLAFSTKSSCHSTKAPGATSLLLALRRRCSSFPNTVTLKNRCCNGVTLGISGALRATLLPLPSAAAPSLSAATAASSPLLPLPAETTWERYRPRESVLNGTIRPYSLSFPESFSDETDVTVSRENIHRPVAS